MIDLVTRENRELFVDDLHEMWRQRYQVFIETLGWDIPTRDGLEIDQFDTEDTAYLLIRDEDNALVGSSRLIPTTGPHLLSDVFFDLCDTDIPRGANIWEGSRGYMIPRDSTYKEKRKVADEMVCGMVEFALLFGVDRIVFEVNMGTYPDLLAVGWDVKPLGVPKEWGGETLIAAVAEATPQVLAGIRAKSGFTSPVIRYQQAAKAA